MGISVSPYLSILPEVKLSCKRCVWAFGVLLGSLWVWVWVGVKKLFVQISPASWTFRVSVWTFHGGTVRQFFNCQSSMAVVTSQCLIVTENVYSKSRSMLVIQMIGQPVLPMEGDILTENWQSLTPAIIRQIFQLFDLTKNIQPYERFEKKNA